MPAAQPSPDAATAKPLPPLGELSTDPGGKKATSGPSSFLSQIMSGVAPIKKAVDAINGACADVIRTGSIPGGEQICAQIVALANSLLPMAAQNSMQPGGGGPPSPGAGAPGGLMGGLGMPPPPGGPQPILGGAGQGQ